MKLLGFTNGKQVVASVARHDYNAIEGAMSDGGQRNIGNNAGYTRGSGESIWFEVPETFAELYNDWRDNQQRKYGIWDLADVKVLSPEEYPDTDSFEWLAENAIWGTNGLDGKSRTKFVHLKDCSKEHLEKIIELCENRGAAIGKIAKYWLDEHNIEL